MISESRDTENYRVMASEFSVVITSIDLNCGGCYLYIIYIFFCCLLFCVVLFLFFLCIHGLQTSRTFSLVS